MPEKGKRLYDSARWRKASRMFLAHNPLCESCLKSGRDTMATVVHHKQPHKGDYDLFWDEDNWESVCKACHDGIKQMQELHGYSQACGVDGMPIDEGHPWNRS